MLSLVVITLMFISCKTETSDNNLPDIHGPAVASSNPEVNDIDFPIADSITINFVEELDVSTVSQDSFSLADGSNDLPGHLEIASRSFTFTPNASLEKATRYTATIDHEITDISGNRMSSNHTWSFESTRHPTIVRTTPANDAQDTDINSAITATFSEAMDSSSINTSTFAFSDSTHDINGSVSYSGLIATFIPDSKLNGLTEYTAVIKTGVQDIVANPIENEYSWSFRTESVAPTAGLIAYYPFNGNANDESGNGNNGAVNGVTLTAGRNGNVNSAYNFDGINDYIEIANDTIFELTDRITISAWIKDAVETGVVVGKCDYMPGGTCNFELFTADGGSFGFHFYRYGWHRVQSTISITDGNWHHIVGTYNRSRIVIYLDGVENNYVNDTSTMKAYGERLQIGQKQSSWPFDYYKGSIDDIRIYNRALSAEEILALFHE
jgi:hypothetical protein